MAVILVVEDDKLSQKVLSKVLSSAGHEAVIAETGAGAWEELRRHLLVDLVILDNQLGREWGWEFLKSLRGDPIYGTIPVVVYTGHTERSSLMKYIEHGVQAMLVKPYKGEVVLKEVGKALAAPWTAQLLEEPAKVCERLQISETDYYASLNAAAPLLESNVKELRQNLPVRSASATAKINDCLTQMKSQSSLLGIPALEAVVKKVQRAVLADFDTKAAAQHLHGVEVLLRLLRQRALAYLGMGDAVRAMALTPEKIEPLAEAAVTPPSDLTALFCRKTANRPLWTFGAAFPRLRRGKLFSEGEIDALIEKKRTEAPWSAFLDAVALTAEEPRMTNEDAAQAILGLGGLGAVYLKIAVQLGYNPETSEIEEEVRRAIQVQGLSKAVALAAAARLASAGRVKSALDLQPLLEQTVLTSLLSFELGRMFKIEPGHFLSVGGLTHNLGRWFFALVEPGLYGIALGLAQSGERTLAEAEKDIFGVDHAEVAQRLLAAAECAPAVQDMALYGEYPEKAKAGNAAALAGTVFVADLIARTTASDPSVDMKEMRRRHLPPNHPIWRQLAANGATLPFEVPELIETIGSIADTSAWVSSVLINWRETGRAVAAS